MRIEVIFEEREKWKSLDIDTADYDMMEINAKIRHWPYIGMTRPFRPKKNNGLIWVGYASFEIFNKILGLIRQYSVDYRRTITIEKFGYEKSINGFKKYVIHTKWNYHIKK